MTAKDFFALNKQVAAEIDARLADFLASKVDAATQLDKRFGLLMQETEHVMRLGGKRLRPTLAVVGYRAAGGEDDDVVLDAAMALELLHAFMCVHDDIMDRDYIRHGGPNINGRYDAILTQVKDEVERHHIAESMSLLAGDILLTFVYEVIRGLNVSAETRLELIDRVNATTFVTAGGQQLDALCALEPKVSETELLKIPHYKTGVYTFVSPLLFGASLAGPIDPALHNALRTYGECLGITFQVVDDMLGMFGTTEATGKPIVSDMRENKPTLLRHYGFELATPKQREVLEANFGNLAAGPKQLEEVKTILTDNGARAKAEALAESYAKRAKAGIEPLSSSAPVQHAQLMALADFCLTRDR